MAKATPRPAGERDPLLPSPASASPPPYLDHHPADSYAVVLVPVRLRRRLRRGGRCLAPCLAALFLLALAGFLRLCVARARGSADDLALPPLLASPAADLDRISLQ